MLDRSLAHESRYDLTPLVTHRVSVVNAAVELCVVGGISITAIEMLSKATSC